MSELKEVIEIINKYPATQKQVDINSVFPNPWNPNIESDLVYNKLKESIKKFGFIVPVLVRELENEVYEIIDGEHKWKAAKELNYTIILVNSLSNVSDEDARLLTISLNNIRGKDDILKRAEVLKLLQERQLSLLPFDKKQIEEELKLLDFDFSKFEVDEVTRKDKDDITRICEFIFRSEKMLRDLHMCTKDTRLKILIENFFEWKNTFCDCILKK